MIKLPESIYDRVRSLARTMPYGLGYKYMHLLSVEFNSMLAPSMEFVLPIHPFIFRTCGFIPESGISDESLMSVVRDHLYKLDIQIHTFFNENNGQFWLKPEHQHMTHLGQRQIEGGAQSIAQAEQ